MEADFKKIGERNILNCYGLSVVCQWYREVLKFKRTCNEFVIASWTA